MITRWQWIVSQLTRQLWFRATLISLLAVAAALVSLVLSPYLPSGLSAKIGADAVDSILSIIATSMLAVTTFSLSTTVAAYAAASSNVTPRATKLLIEDTTTQNVLATFVGSFLYSLVGIIALSMGIYGERGRVVLFAVTICVVLLIVVTLLRWIDYLLRLGRVGETTDQVEKVTEKAMRRRAKVPYLGGSRLADPARDVPDDASPVFADTMGYVEHIDMEALSDCAEETGGRVFVVVLPGTFVDTGRALAYLEKGDAENQAKAIRAAFSVARERTYEQDPRFGFLVLTEIACRALSPGVNDPGTAIDVLGRVARLMSIWASDTEPQEAVYTAVLVPAVAPEEIFQDVFLPIGRDGAPMAEIHIRMQKIFGILARAGDGSLRDLALEHSRLALLRAEAALAFDEDISRVRIAAMAVGQR